MAQHRTPLSADAAAVRRRIEAFEHVMERLFILPGTRQRVGLDVLMDVLPIGGSALAAVIGSYLAWEARNLGMPKSTLVRMAGNIGLDALLGAIPILGVIPDLFFRSNSRNLNLIKAHLDRHHPSTVIIDQ
jgi:Domain of unknown function (DUF4112)